MRLSSVLERTATSSDSVHFDARDDQRCCVEGGAWSIRASAWCTLLTTYLLSAGCNTARAPSSDNAMGDGRMPQIKLVQGAEVPGADASYSVTDASVAADVLNLQLTYTGGCREHEFQLLGASDFAESAPASVRIHLTHNANGDDCKGIVRVELQFGLSPLREHYREVYRNTSGTIVLQFHQRSIEYHF